MRLKLHFTPFQILVHLGAWLPLAWLVWDAWNGNLTVNPIQAAEQRTGRYAITLLVLALACTPLDTVFGWRQTVTVRRALGLYAFLYAAVHLSIFLVLDYSLDWEFLREALFEKQYTLIGLAAFLVLLPMAATSFKAAMKRLGKNWKRLHRLVYLAGGLAVVHYAWAVKGDLLRLQGDIWKPLLYGLAVAGLLVLRLPAVRRFATRQRTAVPARETGRKKGNFSFP